MSYTESLDQTQSYTTADIAKVIDCFGADLDMTSQSTRLLSRALVIKYVADVKNLAQNGYILEANIILLDYTGTVIRAAKYEALSNTGTLKASRPGNSRWPSTPLGQLNVVVQYSASWRSLTDVERFTFSQMLNINWVASNADLSFPSLTRSFDRNYISNGWGVTKSIFS